MQLCLSATPGTALLNQNFVSGRGVDLSRNPAGPWACSPPMHMLLLIANRGDSARLSLGLPGGTWHLSLQGAPSCPACFALRRAKHTFWHLQKHRSSTIQFLFYSSAFHPALKVSAWRAPAGCSLTCTLLFDHVRNNMFEGLPKKQHNKWPRTKFVLQNCIWALPWG